MIRSSMCWSPLKVCRFISLSRQTDQRPLDIPVAFIMPVILLIVSNGSRRYLAWCHTSYKSLSVSGLLQPTNIGALGLEHHGFLIGDANVVFGRFCWWYSESSSSPVFKVEWVLCHIIQCSWHISFVYGAWRSPERRVEIQDETSLLWWVSWVKWTCRQITKLSNCSRSFDCICFTPIY